MVLVLRVKILIVLVLVLVLRAQVLTFGIGIGIGIAIPEHKYPTALFCHVIVVVRAGAKLLLCCLMMSFEPENTDFINLQNSKALIVITVLIN